MMRCAKRFIRDFRTEPVLRIHVGKGDGVVGFRTFGAFSVVDDQEQVVTEKLAPEVMWRVRLESYEPERTVYTLVAGSTKERGDAERLASVLRHDGHESRVETLGGTILLDGEELTDNTEYRVFVGEFNSSEGAHAYGRKRLERYDVEVIREKIREPRGMLEIFDTDYEHVAKVENGVRISPVDSGTEISLYNIGRGWSSQGGRRAQKRYSGTMCFRVGDRGEIVAISDVPIETYLKGILSVEMGADYPLDALKSQAVASRGWTLATLGLNHPDEHYDFCSEPHCQLFCGNWQSHPKIEQAVAETRGEVLFDQNGLCATVYDVLCGGHTDDGHSMCSMPRNAFLRGVFDGATGEVWSGPTSLKRETQVVKWIKSQPAAYCNLRGRKQVSVLRHTQKYFRWEVSYLRTELEDVIRRKTGTDVGVLFDVIPVKRGSSGRLVEIEILGSRKNIRIRGERNIRWALSKELLNSSCFIVETDMGDDGIPLAFTFVGAGWGHGLGLCQTGATVMALEEKSYREILEHYYGNTELKKIY